MLRDPVRVAVTPAATTVETLEQRSSSSTAPQAGAAGGAAAARADRPRAGLHPHQARRRQGGRALESAGIAAEAIHGNKSQSQRERVLAAFHAGRVRVLVATDIAARGIDVEGISHVVNYDLPNMPESYVHRIGRTARAGADGVAISFCDAEERAPARHREADPDGDPGHRRQRRRRSPTARLAPTARDAAAQPKRNGSSSASPTPPQTSRTGHAATWTAGPPAARTEIGHRLHAAPGGAAIPAPRARAALTPSDRRTTWPRKSCSNSTAR